MLPGWNSLEAVSRAHSFFEVAGIVILAMLVLADGAAYVYGRRKEQLVEADAAQLRADVTNAEDSAGRARAEAAASAGRRVSPQQEEAFKRVLSAHPNGRIWIIAHSGDGEGNSYGSDLARVFRAAGWHVDVGNALFFGSRPGVALGVVGPSGTKHVFRSDVAALPRGSPAGAVVLAKALTEAGLRLNYETLQAQEEDFDFRRGPGTFGLTIGHKP